MSARRLGDLIAIEATLVNGTGGPRVVHTNFGSVFDGVTLRLLDGRGRLLLQRGYTHHQSPYARQRPLPIAGGATTGRIVFPVDRRQHRTARQVQLLGHRSFYRSRRDLRSRVVALP